MSEQRFYITDTGLGLDTESDEMYSFGDEEDFCRLFDKLNEQQATISKLEEENEQLRKIGVMYQGHNPCETCTYSLEDKVCCAELIPISCDDVKKNFVQGLCKKHKQIQKSFSRYYYE